MNNETMVVFSLLGLILYAGIGGYIIRKHYARPLENPYAMDLDIPPELMLILITTILVTPVVILVRYCIIPVINFISKGAML